MNEIDVDEMCVWAKQAGAIARDSFNHVAARLKPDHSLVTEADERIETMLVEKIGEKYPEHGIIGEEHTRSALDREFVWAVDPLDGTEAFVNGLPLWGVSLGVLRNGEPHLGVIYLPLLDECYMATATGQAFLNDRQLSPLTAKDAPVGDWLSVPSNVHRRFSIDYRGKVRSLGSIAASFCYVARGSAAGALLSYASIWDVAAGLALLQAVGGTVVGLSGRPLDVAALLAGGRLTEPQIVAGTGRVDELRQTIKVR